MEELTIALATADVVVYDDITKKWLSPDGSTDSSRSHVRILHNIQTNNFRIIANRVQDGQWMLNFKVFDRLKYKSATPMFHQWRDEKRKVYGLNFVLEEEARSFTKVMTQILNILSSSSDYQNGVDLGLSNGVYQEPQQLHVAHNAPSFRDNDSDSVCSGILQANVTNMRKSSQSMHTTTSVTTGFVSNAPQRRSSQGSSSSNGSANFASLSINSTATTTVNGPSKTAQSLSAGGANHNPATTNITSTVVTSNAPPAPPPPPPPSALTTKKKSACSMADQIKNVQLRKVNSASSNFGNSFTGSAFCDNNANGSNGSVRRPWEKPSVPSLNGGTVNNDSPKTHRNVVRVPSGSSLSSQDEPRPTVMPNTNSTSYNSTNQSMQAANGPSMDILEKWKRDILSEIRTEINNAKMEILELIRTEILARR
ncbi:unnamed protein product [Dracunculus medinensis]|uniref:WH1 domain-containing protein n=1 Tax=Dracunculus medinensis TaxID=318479 RepID=A0A0N4U0W7_DRAME|nr:unnamed protein product [Dracunculus medinensis]